MIRTGVELAIPSLDRVSGILHSKFNSHLTLPRHQCSAIAARGPSLQAVDFRQRPKAYLCESISSANPSKNASVAHHHLRRHRRTQIEFRRRGKSPKNRLSILTMAVHPSRGIRKPDKYISLDRYSGVMFLTIPVIKIR